MLPAKLPPNDEPAPHNDNVVRFKPAGHVCDADEYAVCCWPNPCRIDGRRPHDPVRLDSVRSQALAQVPYGEHNAKKAREIYKRIGCWAETSVRQQLRAMMKRGEIKGKTIPVSGGTALAYIYWREPGSIEETREAVYAAHGIDPKNLNPDGSDFHIANAIDEKYSALRKGDK